jgi:hypothetical protein
MRILASIFGLALIGVLLVDVFKAVVLARRAREEFRITYVFYRATWPVFANIGRRIRSGQRREQFLGIYGPLSLMLLFAFWAVGFVLGFSLLRWAVTGGDARLDEFANDLYLSASSFLTVGAGEAPKDISRWINVVEAGLGFSFLGLVIGYLPVFYQSFARRELHISMLDARAGSPPSASELIARQGKHPRQLERQLAAWEEWAADLLQDELSYPMLAYFRSQHLNQSWLGALVAMADTSALIMLTGEGELQHQSEVTFAIARHALIDSTNVLRLKLPCDPCDRLSADDLHAIREIMAREGAALDAQALHFEELREVLQSYERYSSALSAHLLMALPPLFQKEPLDNWQLSSQKGGKSKFAVSDPFQDEDQRSA